MATTSSNNRRSGISQPMKNQIIIRPARPSDLQAINRIYNYYVASSTCVWTTMLCSGVERNAWYKEHGRTKPVLVAVSGSRVVG
jgi:L-amino acid N-acyltransferase YncA